MMDTKNYITGHSSSTEIDDWFEVTEMKGTIEESARKTYIPPKSHITYRFKQLSIPFYEFNSATYFEKITLPNSNGKKYSFDSVNTENLIKSFVILGYDNESSHMILTHKFWISDVVNTMNGDLPTQLNQIKNSKSTALGTGGLVIGAVALLTISAYVESEDP